MKKMTELVWSLTLAAALLLASSCSSGDTSGTDNGNDEESQTTTQTGTGNTTTTQSGTGNTTTTQTGTGNTTTAQTDTESATTQTTGNGTSSTTTEVTNATSGVSSVTLDKTSLTLLAGNASTLTATVSATSNDIATTVTWTSSNESVATVSGGTVTAVALGSATITATSTADTTKKATCAVTVESATIGGTTAWDFSTQPSSIGNGTTGTTYTNTTIAPTSGSAATLTVTAEDLKWATSYLQSGKNSKEYTAYSNSSKATFTLTTATTSTVKIVMSGSSSTNPEYRWIVVTNSSGEIVGKIESSTSGTQQTLTLENIDSGEYTIYTNGIRIYSITVEGGASDTPIIYPSAISLSETTLSLDVSDDSTTKTATLTATIANASEVTSGKDTIEWTSSDTRVATVSNGVVTAKKAGTATITASCTYGGASATCEVTVTGTSSVDLVVTPGAKVTTYGWADLANDREGMKYPDTTNIIVIDDATYTTATSKCTAFTNAIASGSVSSSSVNSTAAIIVLNGEVDLSVNTITSGYTVKTWFAEFDDTTHKRKHNDIVYDIGSNKAIIGVNGAKLSHGGLRIYASSSQSGENIIIQNVEFSDAHGSTEYDTSVSTYSSKKASADALVIEASGASSGVYSYVPQNIWIDHCKFSDGDCRDMIRNYNHDGAFDMKAGKNVTVSYCEFTNHDKVTLLAPDDTYTSTEQRQITFHHIYYHDTVQRTPRSRGCQLHIYNCYYDTIGFNGTDDNGSGSNGGFMFGPGINSQYIVENCYLGSMVNSSAKKMKYFDTSSGGSSASTFSKFYQSGNSYTFTGSSDIATDGDTASSVADHLTTTKPWTPAYSYESTMSTYSEVQTLVPNAAGTDKAGYTATVSVNGTTY